jgi:hypothetical protein
MNEGPDGINTAAGSANLGFLYYDLADRQLTDDKRKEYLCLAESYFKEALPITTKIYGSVHPQSVEMAKRLSTISQSVSTI